MSRELFHEISRRDFLKLCGGVAAALGLSELSVPQVAQVLAESAKKPPLVWLEMGSCTGCSCSFLNADSPTAVDVVLNRLSIRYHEAIMAAQGELADKTLEETIKTEAGKYFLVVEGVVPTKEGYGMFGGKQMVDWLKEAAAGAAAVLAVGSCSAYGGIPGASPNPGGVKPVSELIGPEKVINLPGCPVNPNWLLATVVQVLLTGAVPKLDKDLRPVAIYGQCLHDNCPRRASFDEGKYVEVFGQKEETRDYCLVKVGCKGPNVFSNCPQVRWNSGKAWCIQAGAGCIGCTEPGWPDRFMPFYDRLPDVKLGSVRASADTIGAVVGAATVVGILGHAVLGASFGRFGKGKEASEHKPSAKTEA
ncbi:MAG: hydrogenase small subunit [Bacillota bacterium]|nr:hydrogenase small subunit [Bacillota bacterium]